MVLCHGDCHLLGLLKMNLNEVGTNKKSVLIKNSLLIIAAMIIGGIAYWLSNQHLAQREAELRSAMESKKIAMTNIIVASQDIPENTSVDASNLAVAEIPSAHVPLDALSPEEFDAITGLPAVRMIPRGRPVLRVYLASALNERFSDLLPIGQRALTFAVDDLNSTAGMLKPGDKVDLFLLAKEQHETLSGQKNELVPLLQNVLILATGQLPVEPLSSVADAEVQQQDRYQTVSVAVSPAEAQKILLAKDSGSIVTLLRNRQDSNQLPADILNYAKLKSQGNQVEYFSGGNTSNGSLTAELKPVHSITEPASKPLKIWQPPKQTEQTVSLTH
jgi:pilus assembly protein CpaB